MSQQRGNAGNQKGPGQPVNLGSISTVAGIAVVALIAVIILMNSYTVVDAGTRAVVKTFGEVTDVFSEGLHFRAPFVTSVVRVDVKTQRYTSDASAASRDLQVVTTQVVLNYRPDPDAVGDLISDIGVDYESKVIDPAIQESVKAATAQFNAEELITQRPLVSESIREVLSQRLAPRGILIEDLSITEFRFSEEFNRAIELKQVAEQDALRAEQELRRAQIEAQQQVARAEAEAEARLAVAQAEAEALRLQREVISSELLQLRYIERWNGVLPNFVGDGNSSLLPMVDVSSEAVTTPGSAAEEETSSAFTPTPQPTATPSPTPTPTPTPES
jgi:regulator of protease activity HflC (stomatin/prohibitin superfamily)